MGALATKAENLRLIKSKLEENKARIQLAAANHINAERLLNVALTTIIRTPGLADCDWRTLVSAVIQCSQLGIMPDNILGQAYLIPFKNTKMNRQDVQLIIGFKGLIELARRSGQINDISAHLVYENEKFEIAFGTDERIDHVPLPPATRGEKIVGVYARAVFKDGAIKTEFMWIDEVESIRKSARSSGSSVSPWNTHREEMIKKTAIRRIAKYLPLSADFQKAAALDEIGDAGVDQREIFFTDDMADVTEIELAEDDSTRVKTEEKTKNLADKLKEVNQGSLVS